MDALWVICARVRLGSMSMNARSVEMFESFHFWGKNIFQLSDKLARTSLNLALLTEQVSDLAL